MSSLEVPSWVGVERGSAPILLLAPHGGRRHDVRIPGKHKVNDLRTADVTRDLAAALGASAIVNERVDRNEIDLNRLSQVRRDAPWLIHLLTEMLAAMVTTAGRATVLVVHGWNVSQIACDVGIGMREDADGLAVVRPGAETVSDDFVATRLRPLQELAADGGIMVTIGSRYPAAHPNNLLQIFGRAVDGEAADLAPLAALCREATIDAAQLELAIPLRWPGTRRDRFVALLAEVFGPAAAVVAPREPRAVNVRRLHVAAGRVVRRRGLQLVTDDLLVMTSIEAGNGGTLGGRVVVSEGPGSLALFTGELVDPAEEWAVPPLMCVSSDGLMRFTFEGPLVAFPTHTPFLDLERGLADGTVVEAALELAFTRNRACADDREAFGTVTGHVTIRGRRHAIATCGLATYADAPLRAVFPHCRMTLACGARAPLVLTADQDAPWRHEGGDLSGAVTAGGDVRAMAAVRLFDTEGEVHVDFDGGLVPPLHGLLERLIPVRRPGPSGSVIATTFAVIRIDGRNVGWIEASVLHENLGPAA